MTFEKKNKKCRIVSNKENKQNGQMNKGINN